MEGARPPIRASSPLVRSDQTRRAEVVEEALGLLESLARRTSLPCSPLYGSKDKQRARSFKREWKRRQFLQSLKDGGDRGVLLAEAT